MRATVLVLSAEPVGERMAGPAIRAAELARALAAEHDVTLAAPAPSRSPDPRVGLIEAGMEDFDALVAAAGAHEVLVSQELPPTLLGKTVIVIGIFILLKRFATEAQSAQRTTKESRFSSKPISELCDLSGSVANQNGV